MLFLRLVPNRFSDDFLLEKESFVLKIAHWIIAIILRSLCQVAQLGIHPSLRKDNLEAYDVPSPLV